MSTSCVDVDKRSKRQNVQCSSRTERIFLLNFDELPIKIFMINNSRKVLIIKEKNANEHKKDEEETDKKIKTSRVNVIEVTVPKSILPAMIGRNGFNIKDMEKKSGAKIHFKKFSDKDYDVCIIRGKSEATQIAETMVHEFIKQQPVIVEDVIEVPAWACGRIIGTAGENINDISHRSGARVKIEGTALSDKITQRKVTFKGTKEQIEVAKGLIENCVAQEKCRREIEQSKRSPRHATPPSPAPSPAASVDSPDDATAESTVASIEVYVSAVSSPSRFWVQFVGPQVTQLDELVDHMTEYYGNKDNRAAHALSHVSVGQVVAAVFRHDGRWYRARVQDIRPNEFDATQQVADLFFLDYGDSEYVATHELCELRADLLRLRFQAMECFLAGVRPAGNEEETVGVTPRGQKWLKWHSQAIERFEELTQVARWKPLVSRTCTYKKTGIMDGEKDKEIPGIKLYDVTDEGEIDIGAVLIEEGWAVAGPITSPRHSPPPHHTPFGDLGNSKVLSMLDLEETSPPKESKDKNQNVRNDNEEMKGLESSHRVRSVSNFDLSYPKAESMQNLNGSHEDFLNNERQANESTLDSLVPGTPIIGMTPLDDFKANMNRIESHHSNLETLGRSQTDLTK
ncbi:hypothetical protein K1T71_009899 [Dendrolimus kikuchii]|uniref:Uncharacterized protein n=1 Tax=Dendrolimus kikuchii TaxID=765133 RepID=A0ACC1CT70_9NEOP|nr:hypothetical protein K1T71_009899 [Dendrolimus kikuchii]